MRRVLPLFVLGFAALAQNAGPEQLFRDAVAAQQRGDDATAIAKYQQLLKTRPDVIEVRANLGAALARQGRFDEAIEQYRAALAKDEGNFALRMNLGLAYYKKGAFAEAVKALEPLRGTGNDEVRVATLLADCHARLGNNAQVIAILGPVEASHPDDLSVAWLLGSALIGAGRASDGLERVEKVARRGNSAEAYLLAGRTLLKMDEFERARDDADAALRLNPKLPGALTLRGTVLQYLGDNPGAMAALRKALEEDSKDFEVHLTLGAVLSAERELEEARRHLERARELNPGSNLALYEMARLERTEGNVNAAIRDFERVVKADPNWAQPHLELSVLYFRANRQEDGEREKAVYDKLNARQEKR